jgi:hypothetical protein
MTRGQSVSATVNARLAKKCEAVEDSHIDASKLTRLEEIGSGGFGTVYAGADPTRTRNALGCVLSYELLQHWT